MNQMAIEASSMQPRELETRWHLSIIPLYMAIGSPGLLATLVALSLGANIAEIGALAAAGALSTFVFSMVWGKLSDFSGIRKPYLLFFSVALIPLFVGMSMARSVAEVVLIYASASAVTAGVAPISVMYTVECCKLQDWQVGVARYNSVTSVGNLLGLVAFTFVAPFYETRQLFYISSALCLSAALLLWRMGHEPEMTLERHPFPVRSLRDAEKLLSPRSFLHYLDVRRIKVPRSIRQLSPLQLLFLASFVHWMGISIFGIGQVPLMKELGITDSLILALNVSISITAAIAFAWIAPRVKPSNRGLRSIVIVRCCLILCWAAIPFLIGVNAMYVFALPLMLSLAFNILYSLIWLPITNFAIAQAPADLKGSVQGELISATALSGAVGSAIGGLLISAVGYSAGFIIAAGVALVTIPIFNRIDIGESG
jgi:MFS family permease